MALALVVEVVKDHWHWSGYEWNCTVCHMRMLTEELPIFAVSLQPGRELLSWARGWLLVVCGQ